MNEADVIVYTLAGGLAFAVFLLYVVSNRAMELRKRIAIIRSDGHIYSAWVGSRDIEKVRGKWYYRVKNRKGKDSLYAALGPWYTFDYRLVRSLGVRKYTGAQRIYLEGNPVPLILHHKGKQIEALKDTAEQIATTIDTDTPDRLMQPRKMDVLMLLLASGLALLFGFIIGSMVV